MKKFPLFFCYAFSCFAKEIEPPLEVALYLDFVKKTHALFENMGDFRKGEIEIVTDPKKIATILQVHKATLLGKQFDEKSIEEQSKIGIVTEDRYLAWIRDPVIFPCGATGLYNRIVTKSHFKNGCLGSAILPVMEGKVFVKISYRHHTRSWELEIPRGSSKEGETGAETAVRELKEETGIEVQEVGFLGEMNTDSGIVAGPCKIYWGKVSNKGLSRCDFYDSVSEVELMGVDLLKKGFEEGSMEIEILGRKEKVHVRDSFTAYALFLAQMKKVV